MIRKYLKRLMISGLILQFVSLANISAQYSEIPHGISVDFGEHRVELAVEKKTAFRLSIVNADGTSVKPGIFIDDSDTVSATYLVIAAPPFFGIETDYGKLICNTQTKRWSFNNSFGEILIADAAFTVSENSQTISLGQSEKTILYGSGNHATKELTKTFSNSSIDNGRSDMPYYWNSIGYCALGITSDDNLPARWAQKTSSVEWQFPGNSASLYIWPAKTLYEASKGLTEITGKPKIPPKWSFGFMQSRWGWENRSYIENVLDKFRNDNLPVDAFIYDYEWYTPTWDDFPSFGSPGFNDFGFNSNLFPEPASQIAEYQDRGVKFVGIRKPRLGNSVSLETARSNGWLKFPDTQSRDLDFSIDTLRKWYAEQNKPLLDMGIDAWWNDEGESYYNLYYWWNKAQYDLLEEARPNARHFTINRAFTAGNQKFGYCAWNGDITSTWNSLQNTPADLLNWGLSGMCYGSCDIGGFDGKPTPEMMVRWFQAGVFFPIMRSHSTVSVTPHFPWLWGDYEKSVIREALNLRYRLVPYLYSLGHEAYHTGAPIMRPLVMEFPDDANLYNITDEWLLGKGLLVAPILVPGGSRTVYLPDDLWYDYQTGGLIQGPSTFSVNKTLAQIPIYVRAGTILPLGPVVQHTGQLIATPLEIQIFPGNDGVFTFTEDDGATYNYTKGDVRTTVYTWTDSTHTLSWKVTGTYTDEQVFTTIKAIVGKESQTAELGTEGSLTFNNVLLPHFSPKPGNYNSSVNVSISSGVEGTIYYTSDGTTPTKQSTIYSGSVRVPDDSTITIKAFVVSEEGEYPVTTAVYSVSACQGKGLLQLEKWGNLDESVDVGSIPVNTQPDFKSFISDVFEIAANTGQSHYGLRVSGLLTVPETGYYTFYIAGDDNAVLSLSTDDKPANLKKIAEITEWTNPREWYKYASQKSEQIFLEACRTYAIEALLKQAGGGDNLSVRWHTPSGADEVIPCKWLSPNNAQADIHAINSQQQPVNIYPNPAGESVLIHLQAPDGVKTATTITNIQGRVVYKSMSEGESKYQVNLSGLKGGVYLINMCNPEINVSHKLIVTN